MSSSFAFLIFPTRLHAMSCIAQKLNKTNLDGWRICMTLLENNENPCNNQVPESYGKLLLTGFYGAFSYPINNTGLLCKASANRTQL